MGAIRPGSGGGGGGASIPATPAEVLLDVAAPSTFVVLDPAGIGTSISVADARAAMGLPTADPATLIDGATASAFVTTSSAGDGQLSTAAEALALLYPATTLDLSAATYSAGTVTGGSATHVAGVARLAIGASGTCAYTASATSAPRATIALPPLREAWKWRVEARLASIGSGGSGGNIWYATVGVENTTGTVSGPQLRVAFDGRPDLCRHSDAAQVVTGAAAAVAIDGTGWVAIEADGGMLAFFYGIGSATPPTSWTQVWCDRLFASLGITQPTAGGGQSAPTPMARVFVALERTIAGSAASATVDIGPVRAINTGSPS